MPLQAPCSDILTAMLLLCWQGVAAWEADGAQEGPLQPELASCFAAIERYLDIDLDQPWEPEDKARLVANVAVDGEWDTDEAYCERSDEEKLPRLMSGDDIFLQLLETAVRR